MPKDYSHSQTNAPSKYLGGKAQNVDLWEYLRLDSRPTIVLDVGHYAKGNVKGNAGSAQEIYDSIIFKNTAYRSLGEDEDFTVLTASLKWLHTTSETWSGSRLRWTSTSVSQGRYRVITGASIVAVDEDMSHRDWTKIVDFTTDLVEPLRNTIGHIDDFSRVTTERRMSFTQPGLTKLGGLISKAGHSDKGRSLDWLMEKAPLSFSQDMRIHHKYLHSVKWQKTSLGPMENWSTDLKALVNFVMNSPHPSCFFYGSELICVHNMEYSKVIGLVEHPAQMGLPLSTGRLNLTDHIHKWVQAAYNCLSFQINNVPMTIERELALEETYHNWSATPIVVDGEVQGVLTHTMETTHRQLFRRRLLTLQALGKAASVADDEEELRFLIFQALEANAVDAPFAALYQVDVKTNECTLKSTRSIPKDHKCFPARFMAIKFRRERGLESDIRRVIASKTRVQVRPDIDKDGITTDVKFHGYEVPCKVALIIPIQNDKDDVAYVLILGVNPYRPFDNDYMLWIEALKRQTSSSLSEFQAVKRQIKNSEPIETKVTITEFEKQLKDSELEFIHIAESMVIGVKLIDKEGNVTYANKAWHDATMMPMTDKLESWPGHIHKADRELVVNGFIRAVIEGAPYEAEFRCVQYKDGVYDEEETVFKWCRVDMNVILNQKTKERIGFYATMVDITKIKEQEESERKLKEAAIEMKLQQEAFIDVTSHELRNPLSAILQCAESIVEEVDSDAVDLDNIDEACQTILLCVNFQKRIVDDILVLSKLDSQLLTVSPSSVEVHEVVATGLAMFTSEFQARDIKTDYVIEKSYYDCNVDWAVADPARFTQILVNLVTNAIKFTAPQKRRQITVFLGASSTRPEKHRKSVYLVKDALPRDGRDEKAVKAAANVDWGSGEPIYIMITVQDSGIGISENEAKVLFQRFYQVPKTHVKYGGSGLGLFISRKLAQLQGGEIGVHSEEGVGSAFSYYIKATRGKNPEHETATGSYGYQSKRKNRIADETTSEEKKDLETKKKLGFSVLIVEDNLVNQRVLQKQFVSMDCATFLANNGVEALEVISRSSYSVDAPKDAYNIDLVLMDCEMPVMDGLEATTIIREREAVGEISARVPILGVSANARPGQIDEMMQAGMKDDVLSKPFRKIDLQQKVVALARRRGEDSG